MSLISQAVQDMLASQFASELAYGVDEYPDGTSIVRYGPAAARSLEMAKQASGKGTLTFADLMLGQLYQVLMTEDVAELRFRLTGLLAQGLQWREALDRRHYEQQGE